MAHNGVPTKTKVATIKLTPDQHKLIEKRAERCGVRPSVWMRFILLQAANAAPTRVGRGEATLHIREPDGAIT